MAKQLGDRLLQLRWDGSTYTLRYVTVALRDDTDPSVYYLHTGKALAEPAPRALTRAELSGTLQAFLDKLDGQLCDCEGAS